MDEQIRIPNSTYRLQFNADFTFKQACELIEYFRDLGISHCYASPLLKAKSGSTHGYDIIDHTEINSEIGSSADFEDFSRRLHQHDMGIICDIVPNHMYVMDAANRWWKDVLENGPASKHADYFDIDWKPPRGELHNKVLLPFLDQQYGEAIENQCFKIIYHEGVFSLKVVNVTLPTDPKSWSLILEGATNDILKALSETHPQVLEFKSILTALVHLPITTEKDVEKIDERYGENEVIKRRLAALTNENPIIGEIFSNHLEFINGIKGVSKSFDRLEAFLKAQPYRLCFWRVASDEINYRRFFDVFEYAGIRTEKPEVFAESHALLFEFIQQGLIDGIRIDHIDGLWDPEQYLFDLQEYSKQASLQDNKKGSELRSFYTVAEKILIGNEKFPSEWPINGTVGYDFLNQANGLFIVQSNKKIIHDIYRNFSDVDVKAFDLIVACKKLILHVSMSSELFVLARHLDRIAEQHRNSRDFTAEGLRGALRDVIACFPVYRTYIRAGIVRIHEDDKRIIQSAISQAKRINPAISASIFDFIQNVLLLESPQGLSEEQMNERTDFVMRFQQLTGPVMAKGVEDTAFYRFYPMSSLNEVGSNPYSFGISTEAFHKKNQERFNLWPHAMLASSTHDTKRSEDVRARINVLSEIPDQWRAALGRWRHYNQSYKVKDENDEDIPDANEEYLLYQILIGSWPLDSIGPKSHSEYVNRMQGYMEKAIKEAKYHTSWINPNEKHDQGVQQFIKNILNPDHEVAENPFMADFKLFIPYIVATGMLNSLSQLVLKLTSPGVPDIYQGNEIWDFSLVDPDNRRPVDYAKRKSLHADIVNTNGEMYPEMIKKCLREPEDGKIKMFITMQTLHARQRLTELFSLGSYVPLEVQGDKKEHVIAFARIHAGKAVVVITTRFFTGLIDNCALSIDSKVWHGCQVILPPEINGSHFRHLYLETEITSDNSHDRITLELENVFIGGLALALLEMI